MRKDFHHPPLQTISLVQEEFARPSEIPFFLVKKVKFSKSIILPLADFILRF